MNVIRYQKDQIGTFALENQLNFHVVLQKKLRNQFLGCQVLNITMKRNIIFKVASQIFLVQELGVAVIVMRHFSKIPQEIRRLLVV